MHLAVPEEECLFQKFLQRSLFKCCYIGTRLLFTIVCMHFVTHGWKCVAVAVVLASMHHAGNF